MTKSQENVGQKKRVGFIFSGGPAPAANAVIGAAGMSFLEAGWEVVGFFHGYSNLQEYDGGDNSLIVDVHYRRLEASDLRGIRNSRGILIGTSRANPGALLRMPADLDNATRCAPLARVMAGLKAAGIDALISIGGDDTLKTANLLRLFQKRNLGSTEQVPIVHLPKTIDNDYQGIDFTFGFFTAVDTMAKEALNLRADAMATSSYFIIETMGRRAGWLAYGVGMAGEASLVVGVEDVRGGVYGDSDSLDPMALVDRLVDMILQRESQGLHFGTIVLAEGLAAMLPETFLADVDTDAHGHLALGRVGFGKRIAEQVSARYEARTQKRKKVRAVQLGYESRCAAPHAFDVMLGSQLGVGAYRAIVEEGLDGVMVSVSGQLDLHYVPFEQLFEKGSLSTEVRFISRESDFFRLARLLETRPETALDWQLGVRREP